MKEIVLQDLKDVDSFVKFGDKFDKVYADDSKHLYVFKRQGKGVGYEVVKAVKRKNPDGSTVYTYPSSEQFGVYGFYIVGPEEYCKRRIKFRLESLEFLK